MAFLFDDALKVLFSSDPLEHVQFLSVFFFWFCDKLDVFYTLKVIGGIETESC